MAIIELNAVTAQYSSECLVAAGNEDAEGADASSLQLDQHILRIK